MGLQSQTHERISLCFTFSSSHCLCVFLVAQSCPTLGNPVDYSQACSSVYGDSPGKNSGVGCHDLHQGIFPIQGSNPGLPNCRQIFYHLSHQGSPRILEWVTYHFSWGSSQSRNWTGSCALQVDSLPAEPFYLPKVEVSENIKRWGGTLLAEEKFCGHQKMQYHIRGYLGAFN